MLLTFLFTAPAGACEPIQLADVASATSPGIVILGERHGARRDLSRAARIARRLSRSAPVTVALEAVRDLHQDVLDRLEQGEIRAGQVEEAANWSETWRHNFGAYRPLLRVSGVEFVAAGPQLGKKPDAEEIQVPEAYLDELRPVALDHGMTEEDVPGFAASMAWRDRRIAELALNGWSGDGFLVVVAGRGHVQGGLGITWQIERGLSEAPWTAALLAPSHDCADGDRFLR